MGKKIRMKWRKLDILQQNQDEASEEYQENVLDNLHPFLKSITGNSELAKQYTGAPIQYSNIINNDNNNNTNNISQNQQPLYEPNMSTETANVNYSENITNYVPQDSQYYPQYYYNYNSHPPSPLYIPTQQQAVVYQDTTHYVDTPPVHYVPYYYYYPVPAETYPSNTNIMMNIVQTNSNSQLPEQQTVPNDQKKIASSSSSDSSLLNKVIRRRKKKKKSFEKCEEDMVCQEQEIDSGYFYGPESSSDLTSETESFSDLEVDGTHCDEKIKLTETHTDTVNSSDFSDIQFGDVQEILEELALSSKNDHLNNTHKPQAQEEVMSDKNEESDKTITEDIVYNKEMQNIAEKDYELESDNNKIVEEADTKVSETISKENEGSSVDTCLKEKIIKSSNFLQNKKSKKKKSKNKHDGPSQNSQKLNATKSLSSDESAVENANKIQLKIKSDKKPEQWTEVKRSRKNKSTISNQVSNKQEIIESQEQTQRHKKDELQEEHQEISNTGTVRPLEEIQNLFFEEKTVQIIETPTSHIETKKKKKPKKKVHVKSEGKKELIDNSDIDSELDGNLLFMNPFCNFENFLTKGPPSSSESANGKGGGRITFLDPGFSPYFISDFSPNRSYSEGLGHRHSDLREVSYIYGGTEDQLIKMNVISSSVVRPNKVNQVILLRKAQSFFLSQLSSKILVRKTSVVKKTEIPGPRVQYFPATRSGFLGVNRKVVPPKCIIRRFGKL